MLNNIIAWLDDRTALPTITRRFLDRPVPVNKRWGHALGFALLTTLIVDLITGLLLMTTYSPSSTMAWGSVYYITYQMDAGWFVRGLHRYASYGAVILGGLYLFRLVLVGAYRAPKEMHWWLASAVLLLILVAGVSGNVLPWDQRGYWAAIVETNMAGGTPIIGPMLKKVILGGSQAGSQTLTRFYGLHVALIPSLMLFCGWVFAMLFVFRRRADDETVLTEPYWPHQSCCDIALASLTVALICALTVATHGYSLDAPADPSSDDYPARPEWYFLPLNLLVHEMAGREYIATMVVPGVATTGLFLLPLVAKLLPRKLGSALAFLFISTLAIAALSLTGTAIYRDFESTSYRIAREKADTARDRAIQLARDGIPPEGDSYVLSRDPLHHGGKMFEKKCLGCHPFGGQVQGEPSAPDLKDFGTRTWIRGLLEKPTSDAYFGKVPILDGMKTWKESSKLSPAELDAIADFVATFATIDPEVSPADWYAAPTTKNHPGYTLFQKNCVDCHTMGDPSQAEKKTQPSPDLFGWGSPRWTSRMIKNPSRSTHYGHLEADQKMPAFADQLTENDISALVRYIRGDYTPPPPPAPVAPTSK